MSENEKPTVNPNLWRDRSNLIALFFLGIFNNFSLIAVNALAQQIVEEFDKDNLLGLVVWFNTGITFVMRIIHSVFLLGIPVKIRYFFATLFHLIGDIGLAFSTYTNIVIAFLFIVVIGSASFLGESILMGYLARFPASTVGGLSSGLGLSGALAAAVCIGFQAADLSVRSEFLFLTPCPVICALIFFLWIKHPTDAEVRQREEENRRRNNAASAQHPQSVKVSPADENEAAEQNNAESVNSDYPQSQESNESTSDPTIAPQSDSATPPEASQAETEETSVEHEPVSWSQILKHSWDYILLTLWAYFCQYLVLSACTDLAIPKSWRNADGASFVVKNSFTIINFCVQTGVFVSRCTVSCFVIRPIWIIGLTNALNITLYIVQVATHFIKQDYVWFLFVDALYVGACQGLTWVNIFFLIMHLPLNTKERDLATNICLVMAPAGISIAAGFALLFKNVIFTNVK